MKRFILITYLNASNQLLKSSLEKSILKIKNKKTLQHFNISLN